MCDCHGLHPQKVARRFILTTCPCDEPLPHLLFQDGQGPLQGVGRAVLGSPGQALCVVAHLSLQRVDLANQLLGFHDVLRLVGQRFSGGACGASVCVFGGRTQMKRQLNEANHNKGQKTRRTEGVSSVRTLTFPPGKP